MKKSNSDRDNLLSAVTASFDMSVMTVKSNREVILEGSKGVVEYCDTSIKVNTGRYIVGFSGRGLHIQSMSDCTMVILGFITSIEYIM